MGECLITRRGGEPYKLPILDENYPEDLTVVDGTSATFSVVFAEHGKPAQYTYKWYVNGEEVPNATTSIYNRDISSDKGEYTVFCEVTNRSGTATSRAANLIVNKPPVLNENYPVNVSVDVTNSATFKVELYDPGYPANLTYQWYVNGSAVNGATGASYTISSAAKGATSVYCKVFNGAVSTNSRVATLTGNKLWLFNKGNQYSSVTGGWYSSDSDSGVKNGVIVAHGTTPVSTVSGINVTKYSKLVVTYARAWISGLPEQGAGIIFGLSSVNTGEGGYVAALSGALSGTQTINIANVSGIYYVKSHTYLAHLEVSQVYLE